jgi:hypothetical protein
MQSPTWLSRELPKRSEATDWLWSWQHHRVWYSWCAGLAVDLRQRTVWQAKGIPRFVRVQRCWRQFVEVF